MLLGPPATPSSLDSPVPILGVQTRAHRSVHERPLGILPSLLERHYGCRHPDQLQDSRRIADPTFQWHRDSSKGGDWAQLLDLSASHDRNERIEFRVAVSGRARRCWSRGENFGWSEHWKTRPDWGKCRCPIGCPRFFDSRRSSGKSNSFSQIVK